MKKSGTLLISMGKRKKKKSRSKDLPEKFLERTKLIVGASAFEKVRRTFIDRPTTFRVNTILSKKDEILSVLKQEGFKVRNVPWYTDAFILESRTKRALTELDIYREGKIYIQSLASMVPPLIMDPQKGEKVRNTEQRQ